MEIAVIGTGYVGLVTGTCFAETGNIVNCVDVDANKVARMQKGEIPIYEPHLGPIFERNIEEKRLHFTTELAEGIKNAKVIFLALPTPQGEDGSADLSYVLEVADKLGEIIQDYKVIVDKSTVPVGTASKVKNTIASKTDMDFDVVSNPEFLREGFAVDDLMKPERVVIGSSTQKARKIMEDLYKPFVRQGNPILYMDEESAELTKYAANAFLATKITFMNEIANFCERSGANVDHVRKGMGSDSRIGKRFLFPGIGFGGSCFPKDVRAMLRSGNEYNSPFEILNSVIEINDKQKLVLIDKLEEYFNGNLKNKKIALWGLAFKPDTDDIREAPSLYIIDSLLKKGADIYSYDPEAKDNVKEIYGDKITYCKDMYEPLESADALLIATEWPPFRSPDFNKMKEFLKVPVIFDGRNLYELSEMKENGFDYISIGRTPIRTKEKIEQE
ncbi:MAG: UDP-glucose/GDP-mannose dehydrogenase family protein [Flavobacteriales bacterium]